MRDEQVIGYEFVLGVQLGCIDCYYSFITLLDGKSRLML